MVGLSAPPDDPGNWMSSGAVKMAEAPTHSSTPHPAPLVVTVRLW